MISRRDIEQTLNNTTGDENRTKETAASFNVVVAAAVEFESMMLWTNGSAAFKKRRVQQIFSSSMPPKTAHTPSLKVHVPTNLVQTLPANLTMPPLSSSATYSVSHMPIHVLPPNFGWLSPLLQSNWYALPPTNLSYYTDVKNPQIHSTFEVGEFSAYSKPNVQASSLGITQQQLERLQQQIAAIEATLGTTSNALVPMYFENPETSLPTLSSSYVSENPSPTTLGAIVE